MEEFFNKEFLAKLDRITLLAKRVPKAGTRGEHHVRKKGQSLEFHDYRSYQPGDDFRYIDWNVSARLGRIFVKLFQVEEDIAVNLLIDRSKSMNRGSPDKLTYARKTAAAIGYIALSCMDKVALYSFSEDVERHLPPGRGKQYAFDLFRACGSFPSADGTSINRALTRFAANMKRPGLTVVISDFLDPDGYEEGLHSLLYKKHQIIAVQICSDDEIFPPYRGRLKMIDPEDSTNTAAADVDDAMYTEYRKRFEAYRNGLKTFCSRRGAEYFFTSTSSGFEYLILQYLREGTYLH